MMALNSDFLIIGSNGTRTEAFKRSELQAQEDFKKSIEKSIKAMGERAQTTSTKTAKWWEVVKEECFNNTRAYCLVHDDNFIDHTIRR